MVVVQWEVNPQRKKAPPTYEDRGGSIEFRSKRETGTRWGENNLEGNSKGQGAGLTSAKLGFDLYNKEALPKGGSPILSQTSFKGSKILL